MTGKYDMKMLSRLGKMEEEFKQELADIWEVEDEDELPDSLQELDFNDIMASGDTTVLRNEWLTEQISLAEGFDDEKAAKCAGLIDKTINAIQMLEDDYVHK
eukprot:CAMPEP_0114343934 /NCGR_PEP_ID=MMETSP0101-20121206/11018_1 /TAXON_ID=38822 ORGANISM="Pteridomonas danica, Strain PT" /NCGR_SAMPLE_ID=MMETSP0101 /ASSEMBLY_ACC=CAM_ASM_000211 /LENGTH=101 /DNA_ID=CAMNT_0001478983 /DNA_START=126 /DNA_END=431 /DNA_ORIENTATION=-